VGDVRSSNLADDWVLASGGNAFPGELEPGARHGPTPRLHVRLHHRGKSANEMENSAREILPSAGPTSTTDRPPGTVSFLARDGQRHFIRPRTSRASAHCGWRLIA